MQVREPLWLAADPPQKLTERKQNTISKLYGNFQALLNQLLKL